MGNAATPRHPQTDPPQVGQHAGYPVYPMPMYALVEARDPRATVRWFTEVLDFGVVFTTPGAAEAPALTHLRRGKYQDVLVVPAGEPPAAGENLTLALQVGDAAEIERLAERIAAAGDTSLEGPHDTPWNTREFTVRDPDGNRFRFTGLARQPSGTIDEVMTSAGDAHGQHGEG